MRRQASNVRGAATDPHSPSHGCTPSDRQAAATSNLRGAELPAVQLGPTGSSAPAPSHLGVLGVMDLTEAHWDNRQPRAGPHAPGWSPVCGTPQGATDCGAPQGEADLIAPLLADLTFGTEGAKRLSTPPRRKGAQPRCIATLIDQIMMRLLAGSAAGDEPASHHDIMRVLQAVRTGKDIYAPDAGYSDTLPGSQFSLQLPLGLAGEQEAGHVYRLGDYALDEPCHALESLMSGLYYSAPMTRAGSGESRTGACSLTLDQAVSSIINMRSTSAELGGGGHTTAGRRWVRQSSAGRCRGRSSWSGPLASHPAMSTSPSLAAHTLGAASAAAAAGFLITHSSSLVFQQLPAYVFDREREGFGPASLSSADSEPASPAHGRPQRYVPVIIDAPGVAPGPRLPAQPEHARLHRSSTYMVVGEAGPPLAAEAVHGMRLVALDRSRSSLHFAVDGQEQADDEGGSAPVDMKEVRSGLATAEEWQWDVFQFDAITGGHALSVLGFYVFHQAGLISRFGLDAGRLARFLRRVEEGYVPNPYHNATHAADVLQSMHVLMHKGALLSQCVEPQSITLLACYLAAIVHDYEHLGVTNDYLIAVGDPLAVMYNDTMPLENYHIAATFALLSKPEYNFMESLSELDFAQVRKLVIDLVMATNMKSHVALMAQFHEKFAIGPLGAPPWADGGCRDNSPGHQLPLTLGPLHSSRPVKAPAPQQEPEQGRRGLDPRQDSHLALALQLAIKCSDVGHAASSWAVHRQWARRLQDEFFLQGDLERAQQLPVSKMCDRQEASEAWTRQSQLGFFDAVVIPMFWAFCQVFPSSTPQLVNALDVRRKWAAEGRDEPAAAAAAAAAPQGYAAADDGAGTKPGFATH